MLPFSSDKHENKSVSNVISILGKSVRVKDCRLEKNRLEVHEETVIRKNTRTHLWMLVCSKSRCFM